MAHSPQDRLRRQRQAVQSRENRQRMRSIAFGLIVLGVIVAAGYFLAPLLQASPASVIPSGAGKVVNLQAAMDGFDLEEIRHCSNLTVRAIKGGGNLELESRKGRENRESR